MCFNPTAWAAGGHQVPLAVIMSYLLFQPVQQTFYMFIFLQGSDFHLPFIHSVDICWQPTMHWAFFCSPLTPQGSLWNSQAPFQVTLQEPYSVWKTNENIPQSNSIIDKKEKHRLIISWKWPFEVCIEILNLSTTRKLATHLPCPGSHRSKPAWRNIQLRGYELQLYWEILSPPSAQGHTWEGIFWWEKEKINGVTQTKHQYIKWSLPGMRVRTEGRKKLIRSPDGSC